MSQTGCDVNDVKKPSSLDARDLIELVAGTSIGIDVEKTPDKTIYTINYREYSPLSINVTQDVSIAKVGTTVPTVTFVGNIVKGSEDIVSRTMVPDKSLNLEEQFTWTEENVIGLTPGLYPQFSGKPTEIEAIDFKATKVTKQVGVEFRHLFYIGYSTKNTLTESEIKNIVKVDPGIDLLNSVFDKYRTYNYRNDNIQGMSVPVYVYWVIPSYSPPINGAIEDPLPVPITNVGSITISEIVGYPQSYVIYRTSVKSLFTGKSIKLI